MVISALNPVHSVLWLILAFASATVLFIMLEVEFIALIIFNSVCGRNSDFIFICDNDVKFNGHLGSTFQDMSNYMPAGFVIGVVVFLEVLIFLSCKVSGLMEGINSATSSGYANFRWDFIEKISNVEALGRVSYTDY